MSPAEDSPLKIVPASARDAELIARLGRETFAVTHVDANPPDILGAYMDAAFALEKVRAELEDPRNLFHLAYQGDVAVGYSKIVYDAPCMLPAGPGRFTKLERLYFQKTVHGKTLGWDLFEFNRKLALAHAQTGMWLTVWPGNARAIRFYERVGFRKLGDVYFQLTPQIRNPNDLMFWRFS